MALVCPDSSEIVLLQYIVGLVEAGNPVLHIYTNDITPSDSTVVGDLTEASDTSYDSITLVSSNWTTSQTGGVTSAVYSQEAFSFGTTTTCYGYYVTDSTGNLLWLERFNGAPFNIPAGGGSISITAKLTLS